MSAHTRPVGSRPKASSAGASFSPPRLTNGGGATTWTSSSEPTVRSGRRTVSPATRTLPARMRAWAWARDSAIPACVSAASNLIDKGTLQGDQPYGYAESRSDQDLDGGVAEQLAQSGLLEPSLSHQVVHQAVQDGGLAARGAPDPLGVVHDHDREDKRDRKGIGSD